MLTSMTISATNSLSLQYADLYNDISLPTNGEGVFDATRFGNRCPQMNLFIDGLVNGDEDCLHISIYSPLQVGH